MDLSSLLPGFWAQISTPTLPGPGGPTPPSQSLLLSLLAIRRWFGSLTLSRPDASLGPVSAGLWVWLLGLGALLLVAMLAQGPGRAIGQLLDLSGHARLLAAAVERVRRSGRLLVVAVGSAVVAWTASQGVTYSSATGRDDELILIKGRRLVDVALDQGYLAALTPLRDVVGLGLVIPLLIAASVALFQFSTDRWGTGVRPPLPVRRRSARWATIGWGVTALYALYRFVSLVTGNAELPMGGCVILEAAILPALMALSDGVLVAWALVELRNAGLGGTEGDALDPLGVTLAIPSAALACVLAYPARYVGTAAWLALVNLPTGSAAGTVMATYLKWQLGWGLVYLQGAAVLLAGLFGAVAWSRGSFGDSLMGYWRMVSGEGGRLVAALAAGGLAAGASSALAYGLVLSLPTSTWALHAADSYAHYATLPIGLILAAALVELGERTLPEASAVGEEAGGSPA